MGVTNILMSGVGGQGIILASEVLARTAADQGLDVKKSDVHGMAQRGGAVTSHVRFGDKVYSPLIPDGRADVIMASEIMEALRWLPFLKEGGRLAVSSQRIPPPAIARGEQSYPQGIEEKLKERDSGFIILDTLEIAKRTGNPKTATVVLLGGMSVLLPFPEEAWLERLQKEAPQKAVDVNLEAFKAGREGASRSC